MPLRSLDIVSENALHSDFFDECSIPDIQYLTRISWQYMPEILAAERMQRLASHMIHAIIGLLFFKYFYEALFFMSFKFFLSFFNFFLKGDGAIFLAMPTISTMIMWGINILCVGGQAEHDKLTHAALYYR